MKPDKWLNGADGQGGDQDTRGVVRSGIEAGVMSLRTHLQQFVHVALGGGIEKDGKLGYDRKYIEETEFAHLTVTDDRIRCDVCGKQYKRGQMKMFWKHLLEHYENGVIEDPYVRARVGGGWYKYE